jgi:hypothetical protein
MVKRDPCDYIGLPIGFSQGYCEAEIMQESVEKTADMDKYIP